MKIPCENCICLPVCRNKTFTKLMKECNIITTEIWKKYYKESREKKTCSMDKINQVGFISNIYSLMKPCSWKMEIYDEGTRVLIFDLIGDRESSTIYQTIKIGVKPMSIVLKIQE